jgi:hypothetical protein
VIEAENNGRDANASRQAGDHAHSRGLPPSTSLTNLEYLDKLTELVSKMRLWLEMYPVQKPEDGA